MRIVLRIATSVRAPARAHRPASAPPRSPSRAAARSTAASRTALPTVVGEGDRRLIPPDEQMRRGWRATARSATRGRPAPDSGAAARRGEAVVRNNWHHGSTPRASGRPAGPPAPAQQFDVEGGQPRRARLQRVATRRAAPPSGSPRRWAMGSAPIRRAQRPSPPTSPPPASAAASRSGRARGARPQAFDQQRPQPAAPRRIGRGAQQRRLVRDHARRPAPQAAGPVRPGPPHAAVRPGARPPRCAATSSAPLPPPAPRDREPRAARRIVGVRRIDSCSLRRRQSLAAPQLDGPHRSVRRPTAAIRRTQLRSRSGRTRAYCSCNVLFRGAAKR